jgi:hypothetical protein
VNVSGENPLGGARTIDGVTTIRVNLEQADALADRGPQFDARVEGAAIMAHEGQHGLDQRSNTRSASFERSVDREERAYLAQAYVNMGHDQASTFGLWTPWNGFNRDAYVRSVMQSVFLHCTLPGSNCQ